MSAPLLAQTLGGNVFFGFVSAIAFATILAVVAGLTISASTSFAHDFWTNVIHRGTERAPGEEVRVARITAFVVGAVAILIAIVLRPDRERRFPCRARLRRCGVGQFAGHRLLTFLETLQHDGRGRWLRHRLARFDCADPAQPQHHDR